MFKIIVKSADTNLIMQTLVSPQEAAAFWGEQRSKPEYADMPIGLIASYNNKIFLRHYFNCAPGETQYVPEKTVDLLEPIFIAGMGGSTYTGRLSEDRVDYSTVDWSKSNAELSRLHGVSPQAIAAARKRQTLKEQIMTAIKTRVDAIMASAKMAEWLKNIGKNAYGGGTCYQLYLDLVDDTLRIHQEASSSSRLERKDGSLVMIDTYSEMGSEECEPYDGWEEHERVALAGKIWDAIEDYKK